jgi:hypothetical protein
METFSKEGLQSLITVVANYWSLYNSTSDVSMHASTERDTLMNIERNIIMKRKCGCVHLPPKFQGDFWKAVSIRCEDHIESHAVCSVDPFVGFRLTFKLQDLLLQFLPGCRGSFR